MARLLKALHVVGDMARVPANRKLQIVLVVLAGLFFVADQFFLDDAIGGLRHWANSYGVSDNEFRVYILIFANIVMLVFPAWCYIVSNKIKLHQKYPYPGMLLPIETEQLEGEKAIVFAKRLKRRAYIFPLVGLFITYMTLSIFGAV